MKSLIIASFVVLLAAAPVMAGTIAPADDTKIKNTMATISFGWQDSITCGNHYSGTDTYKMYMRFDLDSLAADVDTATLYLYHQLSNMGQNDTEVIDVYGMIDGTTGETTWVEGTSSGTGINWNNAPCNVTSSMTDFTNATSLGSFNVTEDLGWYTFSSQALVDFMNADSNDEITLMFSTATTGMYGSFRSKEWIANPEQHPYMDVTEVPEPSTMLLACLGLVSLIPMLRRRMKRVA